MDESCSIQAPSSSCIKKNETTEVVSQKSNFEGSPQNEGLKQDAIKRYSVSSVTYWKFNIEKMQRLGY